MKLQSNEHLFRYLAALVRFLKSEGRDDLASEVDRACSFALGSSSEFLHESQLALKHVWQSQNVLDEQRIAEIKDVMIQIEVAFIKVGGA